MHFWINKPASRYYGFTGRRYPATPLPKTRFNRCRYNADLRQMVTPLHRFQHLNAAGNVAGPSSVNNCRAIRTIRANNETQSNLPVGSAQRTQLNNNSNNATTTGNNQLVLSNTTSNGTNRSLLAFSELIEAELANYRLQCVGCISFVLVILVITAFYFEESDHSIFLIFNIWIVLAFLLCSCILCRRRLRNRADYRVQEEQIATVTTTNTLSNENIRPISVVSQNPPPPYHIAILIPPPNTSDEAPPPSYDKVMR